MLSFITLLDVEGSISSNARFLVSFITSSSSSPIETLVGSLPSSREFAQRLEADDALLLA